MNEALLEHYAAFVESQTRIPAATTIASIKAREQELAPDMSKAIADSILRVMKANAPDPNSDQ